MTTLVRERASQSLLANDSGRIGRPRPDQIEYLRPARARKHTAGTLRQVRHATAAIDRRDGIGPPPVPAHVERAVPAWSGFWRYLRLVQQMQHQRVVIEACKAAQVAVSTWLAVAVNDAKDADYRTGRNMRTSQVVAAQRINRSDRTVRRARAVSVRLGLMVEIYRGRELSGDERIALVKEKPGHQQRGIPNVYAMTVCPTRTRQRISIPRPGRFAHIMPLGNPQPQRFVHLPPEGAGFHLELLLMNLPPPSADAAESPEPPSAAQQQRKRRAGIGLAHTIRTHPGTAPIFHDAPAWLLAPLLGPYQRGGWTPIALALEVRHKITLATIPTWQPAHAPKGLLGWALDQIDPIMDVHLGYTDPDEPHPCTNPDCDGYGFINTTTVDGRETATICTHCTPTTEVTLRKGDVESAST